MPPLKKVLPKEAIDYLKAKGLTPSTAYDTIFGEEHNLGFMVAGITSKSVLRDIRKSLMLALEKGVPFEQWAKEMRPTLTRLGWDSDTNKAPYRIRTVYDTNMRVARAVGQWDRITKTQRALPFLKYMLGPSERHREEHVRFAGTTLPVGHPWWDEHFPPNGYGCKCWVQQLTKGQATQQGVTKDPDDGVDTYVNRDGVGIQSPRGVQPGWGYNPGKLRQQQMQEYADTFNEGE